MNSMCPEDLLARIIHGTLEDPRPASRRSKADPPSAAHWTGPILLERCAYLRKMARAGEGFATDTLRESPSYRAQLTVRLRNSPPEQLDSIAQLIFVLEGRATLLTGDTSQELRPGDVLHIAPAVPTQFLVPNEKPFSYLLIRITEPEPSPEASS